MTRPTLLPPDRGLLPDGSKLGGWWRVEDEQRIVCELCPRACSLKEGDRGFCFVRENRDGQMVLTTYGRSTGFCVDPIEKKPLNHFLPGTAVLSFGTAGCNLGCKFCQNWDISKSREVARLSEQATPEMIAQAARKLDCRSVAYTYNDPVIWAEYAMDVADACRDLGVKSVAVTAGYITPQARGPFFQRMDAANVDLKAFTEEFYFKLTQSHLQPVLDTLRWLKTETDVWFEITNLLIPRANDDLDEVKQMCHWILESVGDEVPVHFTAFHPDFRLKDRERTPHETLLAAHEAAEKAGIKFVYVGNVNDVANQSTYCPQCRRLLIERNWHELGRYQMDHDRCGHCGAKIAGLFEAEPGQWGRKRLPVRIAQYAPQLTQIAHPASSPNATSPNATSPNATSPNATSPNATSPNAIPAQAQVVGPAPITSPLRSPSTTPQPKEADMASQTSATSQIQLADSQSRAIHQFACTVVAASVLGRQARIDQPAFGEAAKIPVMGSFVTLKREGRLRACCGFLSLQEPTTLSEAVQHASLRTAREDHRFPTISCTELPYLTVDVQLLHSPKLMAEQGADRVGAVQVGRHGLQIRRGNNSGLLLPVVAVENELTAEEFLRHVCIKAGLPTTAWQQSDTQLLTFEGDSLPGPLECELLDEQPHSRPLFTESELANLAEHARQNLAALLRGATPNYYLFGCSDANVPGIALRIQVPGQQSAHDVAKISLREAFPLQSTLFTLVESAAAALRRDPALARLADLDSIQLTLSVLHDPAMHGVVAEPDLRGIDPVRRAVLVMEGNKTCWMYDPEMTARQLLQAAGETVQIRNPEAAPLYSLHVQSTAPRVTFSSRPLPQAGPAKRPAAVAGTFYPNQPEELEEMVRQMLGEPCPSKQKRAAVMLPHAGLVYSGRIAAETLKQIEIPETVIIIGPKHTRLGVDWAVAPHETWILPGAEVSSDPDLARRLAEAIDGLELDAQAHRQEHGVEVELPFLAQLAPHTRVVGIAMGGGSLEQCRTFARQLAAVLKQLDPPPLLIISSDMNHYAPDDENRRLDELALQAMETMDPEHLLSTVRSHNISMCGVLPAVVIMETLKELGALNTIQRVDYATSADVSGDKSRVVGYAGMLIG